MLVLENARFTTQRFYIKYIILEYFNLTLHLIGGIIRVLGHHMVLGPHMALGPPRVLSPRMVLGPHRVQGPHRVLGPEFSQGPGSRYSGMPVIFVEK